MSYNAGMNRVHGLIAVGLAFSLVAFVSCVSTDTALPSASIERTVELFSSGTVGEIVSIAAMPFLFDAEIIVRESDLRTIVSALKNSSIDFAPAAITSIQDGAEAFAAVFGSSYEVTVFARKYVPDGAVLLDFETDRYRAAMLLGDRIGRYRSILALAVKP